MIAIVDYGMGNLRSAQKGFEKAGHAAVVSDDPDVIAKADAVVIPGVGAFKDCYDGLCDGGLDKPVREAAAAGKALLGICVGHQLLFEESTEGKGSRGLGLLAGRVVRFPNARDSHVKVPHMGWNQLETRNGAARSLIQNAGHKPYVYFVHSYYAEPADESIVLATATHGVKFAAMVGKDNVYGVQFHPEKSQREGIAILKHFGDLVESTK